MPPKNAMLVTAKKSNVVSRRKIEERSYVGRNTPKVNSESFTLFGRLPPELRIMIWRLALERPRFVELKMRKMIGDLRVNPLSPRMLRAIGYTNRVPSLSLESITPVPSLLHVNNESRVEALKFYQLSFKGKYNESAKRNDQKGPKVYFNSDFDTLLVTHRCVDTHGPAITNGRAHPPKFHQFFACVEDLKKITHLAVETDLAESDLGRLGLGDLGWGEVDIYRLFVKELTLIETREHNICLAQNLVLTDRKSALDRSLRNSHEVLDLWQQWHSIVYHPPPTLPAFIMPNVNVKYVKEDESRRLRSRKSEPGDLFRLDDRGNPSSLDR